jgi:hypothetical protein
MLHLPTRKLIVIAMVTTGLLQGAPLLGGEDRPLRQIIDAEIQAAWQKEKLTPAALADDAVFLRRVYLDLAGTIPTYEETVSFLKDADADKRSKLIDKLLDDPRYAVQQAQVWDRVLFGRESANPEVTRQREVFHKWLVEKFAKNEPYDRWVRELVVAEGSTAEQGPPMFYVQFNGKAEETAVAVTRIFLGMQLQCAQCHDHPYDKWKQLDFYGMAGFFARVAVVDGGGGSGGKKKMMVGEKRTGEVLFTGPAGEQKPGQKGKPVPARFLGGVVLEEPPLPKDYKEPDAKSAKVLPPKPDFSRREKLAEWMTAADNPYFARAVANRVWGQFMGRGLVHPVDDIRDKKPPSHADLFNALSSQLAAKGFNLKWLIREVVNSQAYQLAQGKDAGEAGWFERARLRALTGEEMLSALVLASGLQAGDKLPNGLADNILRQFGSASDGRGDFQASMTERLFMNNSAHIRQLIARKKGNLADQLLAGSLPPEERVDRLFLTVLNRMPRAAEKERFVKYLAGNAGKPEALVEDAIWVLLNCSEFRFNH